MILFGGEWKLSELFWLGRSAAVAAALALAWVLARRRYSGEQIAVGALIWLLSLVLMGYYIDLAEPDPQTAVRNILAGNVGTHVQFMLLVPWITLALSKISGLSLDFSQALVMYFSLLAALAALWFWFSAWMKREGALLGIFLTAAVWPTTFRYWKYHEFSELALFTLGYLLLARYPKKLLALFGVFAAASLNREPGVFFLWPYFLVTWARGERRRAVVTTLSGALLYSGYLIGLGILFGRQYTHHYDGWMNWPAFCRGIWMFVRHPGEHLNVYMIAGGLWPLALWRFRSSPLFLRLSVTTIVPIIVMGFPFVYLAEIRIFNPVLPIVLALIIWQFAPSLRREDAPVISLSSVPTSSRQAPLCPSAAG